MLKFVAIHIWEVGIVNVLLELRVGPGVGRLGEIRLWTEAYPRNVDVPKGKQSSFVITISWSS